MPYGVSCVAYRVQLGRVGGSRWGWVLQIKFPCHTFAPCVSLFLSVAASSVPALVCWGVGVSFDCLQSPIRSRGCSGRLPVGLGSSNKIPVPYKPTFSLSLPCHFHRWKLQNLQDRQRDGSHEDVRIKADNNLLGWVRHNSAFRPSAQRQIAALLHRPSLAFTLAFTLAPP